MATKNTVTLTSKGQIVVPAEMRKRLGWKRGTKLLATEENGKIVLQTPAQATKSAFGCIQAPPGAWEDFVKERKREDW